MDLSRENLEMVIIGELFIDEQNIYIDRLNEDLFGDGNRKLLFLLLKSIPDVRNDLVSFSHHAGLAFQEKRSYYVSVLKQCIDQAVMVSALETHIKILKELNRNDSIISVINRNNGDLSEEDVKDLRKIINEDISSKPTIALKELSLSYSTTLSDRAKIHAEGKYQNMTGFSQLDNIIGGIMPKNVVVVGGRTSMGKSSLMSNIGVTLVKNDRKVLYISCEMTEIELFDRIIASISGVEAYKLRYGRLNDFENKKVVAAMAENSFFEKNLWLYYKPGITIGGILERVNNLKPDVLIVDHIQLLKPGKEETLAQAISESMNRLAGLAGENNIGVIVGSQMNRESTKEGARGFEPVYFKGSGGIEENASVCLEIKMQDASQKENMNISVWDIYLEILKNRHGRTGRMKMQFDRQILQFREVDDNAKPKYVPKKERKDLF